MPTQTKKTKQYILNSGVMQHLLTMPTEGLLVRLTVQGERLKATFEEGAEQPGMSLQMITWALEGLQVDAILDEDRPFRAYNPGVVCGNQ